MLKDKIGVAVFNGDATTSNDADAIAKQNVPVVQIATINGCHLDANLVGKGLRKIDLGKLKLIFIENIGNLICPAEFPLGSKARVVVVSVTEGPWMVRKHPHMFLGIADRGDQQNRPRRCHGSERRRVDRRRAHAQARYQGYSDQLQNRRRSGRGRGNVARGLDRSDHA